MHVLNNEKNQAFAVQAQAIQFIQQCNDFGYLLHILPLKDNITHAHSFITLCVKLIECKLSMYTSLDYRLVKVNTKVAK